MENLILSIKEVIYSMFKSFSFITVNDIADIILVTIVLYLAFKFIRDKRAGRLIIGILVLTVIKIISDFFELTAMNYILRVLFQNGLVVIVVIFQPELRSLLEIVADPLKNIKLGLGEQRDVQDAQHLVSSLRDACCDMSKEKTGALIVIERETKLGEIIDSGVKIDSKPSCELIKNIFFKNTPLHDGAMVIRQNRIEAAGCFLPLTRNDALSRELGTRHRAALGMSETSDAVVIVVSEETGAISIAVNGKITRNYDYSTLNGYLNEVLIKPIKKERNNSKKRNRGRNKIQNTEATAIDKEENENEQRT